MLKRAKRLLFKSSTRESRSITTHRIRALSSFLFLLLLALATGGSLYGQLPPPPGGTSAGSSDPNSGLGAPTQTRGDIGMLSGSPNFGISLTPPNIAALMGQPPATQCFNPNPAQQCPLIQNAPRPTSDTTMDTIELIGRNLRETARLIGSRGREGFESGSTLPRIELGRTRRNYVGQACGSDQVPDVPDASAACDRYMVNGAFNAANYQRDLGLLVNAHEAMECRRQQHEFLTCRWGCLAQQDAFMRQQMTQLQTALNAQLAQSSQAVQFLNELAAERGHQKERVARLLDGGESGRVGINAMRDQVREFVNGMPARIAGLEQARQDLTRERDLLEEDIAGRKAALASECFTTQKFPQYQCSQGGPAVSPREHVVCVYDQRAVLDSRNQVQANTFFRTTAAGGKARLEQLLANIISDMTARREVGAGLSSGPQGSMNHGGGSGGAEPYSANGASGTTGSPGGGSSTSTVNSLTDLVTQYSDQLAQMNRPNLNVHDFVIQILGFCFDRANRIVEGDRGSGNTQRARGGERGGTGGPIGERRYRIQQLDRGYQVMVEGFFNEASQIYTRAVGSLSGTHYPMDVSRCRQASPDRQLECARQIQEHLNGLLTGTGPDSSATAMNIEISSAKEGATFHLQCRGLDGCATKLQTTQERLVQEQQRVSLFRGRLINAANAQTNQMVSQMANALQPMNAYINSQFSQLGAQMGALGASVPGPRPEDGEDMTPSQVCAQGEGVSEQCLMQAPRDIAKLVGGRMQPRMLSLTDSVSDANSHMVEIRSRADEHDRDIVSKFNALQDAPLACQRQRVQTALTALASSAATLADDCGTLSEVVCNGERAQLERLLTDWGNVRSRVEGLSGGGTQLEEVGQIDNSLRSGQDCGSSEAERPTSSERRRQQTRCRAISRTVRTQLQNVNRAASGASSVPSSGSGSGSSSAGGAGTTR